MRKIIKVSWVIFTLLVFMGFGLAPTSRAQTNNAPITQSGPWRTIRLDPRVRERYVPPPLDFLAGAEQAASANIVVNYNGGGWTTQARDAFEFAVGIWEMLITSPVIIEVDADFGPLGPNILGGAGPVSIRRNFTNAPYSGTWYPVATANQLAGFDIEPGIVDIEATFSSTYSAWDFGTDGSTDPTKISFASVVLHEIGHGLGFLGSMRVDDGTGRSECMGTAGEGCYGYFGSPMIYDTFTENSDGTSLTSFTNNSSSLTAQLTSNDLFFDSLGGNSANGGMQVPIYAPEEWERGSSYSHLAESFNPSGHALMTFSISRGETIHHPGAVTLCMFEEMGWTVSENCIATPDIPINGLEADNDGPTLLGNETQFTATLTAGSNVTYEWDFGDGDGESGSAVAHQYASQDIYTVELTATNLVSQETATTLVYITEQFDWIYMPLLAKQP
jgi:PKD repeat protein